jgi:hypothetical protein
MTRAKKQLLNSGVGLLKQLIVTICGFILPRYLLKAYGSDVNGLIASITHFLSFISFLEMGIGPVVQASLYGPLAKNDSEQISKVVKSSKRFYHRLGYIFTGYILVLSFVFPLFIAQNNFDIFFTVALLLIISISTLAQYFFGATYQLLLNADQKSYVPLLLHIVTVVLNTVFCVILISPNVSILWVKLVTSAFYVMRPLGQMIYVRRHYKIDSKVVLTEEPIKQKWNGFSQHLQDHLELGNMDSLRDWGYAKDYVECMWLILQQDQPDDFVIATGVQHTVRDFTERAFAANGITLRWEGAGLDEKGYDVATGKMLVCVNPQWFRPTDVDNLWGDPTKAKTVLGWDPQKTSYEQLVALMAAHDRQLAKREKAMRAVEG